MPRLDVIDGTRVPTGAEPRFPAPGGWIWGGVSWTWDGQAFQWETEELPPPF